MKPFSVLLLYPDYMAYTYGEDYYDFVLARDSKSAVKKAQKRMAANYPAISSPDDCKPLLVIAGHHRGLEVS